MKVILPAAGYAVRLYPISINKPKALLEIGGKPIVMHLVKKLCMLEDIDGIFIVTNDKFYQSFLQWRDSSSFSIPLEIVNDGTKSNEERLGTIGDISFVLNRANIYDDFLVIHPDNFFSFSLDDAIRFFNKLDKPIIGVFDVCDKEIAKRLGIVKISDQGKVLFFKEKDPDPETTLCSVGVYFFPKDTIKLFEVYVSNRYSTDNMGKFIEWLYKRGEVYGYVFPHKDGYWFDIGTLEAYELACDIYDKK